MDKTKIILASTGGVIGVAVLVMGFFTWSAFSDKAKALEGDEEEGTSGLEETISKAESLSRKPVYPCKESETALTSNRNEVVTWQEDAKALATRGDRFYEPTTPPAFKAFIVADAKRLVELPGGVGGKLAKPDFAFGPFKSYIVEGKLPETAQLAELQRKWDDVATVTELLSSNGVFELRDVQFVEVKEAPKEDESKAKGKARAKSKAKAKRESVPETTLTSHSYVFAFSAKPSAFVRTVNALSTVERFITVESFAFSRAQDVVAEALGSDEKKEASASARTGRRGRRNRTEEAKPAEKDAKAEKKGQVVTDPAEDDPLLVTMRVAVGDFGSLEQKEEEK